MRGRSIVPTHFMRYFLEGRGFYPHMRQERALHCPHTLHEILSIGEGILFFFFYGINSLLLGYSLSQTFSLFTLQFSIQSSRLSCSFYIYILYYLPYDISFILFWLLTLQMFISYIIIYIRKIRIETHVLGFHLHI